MRDLAMTITAFGDATFARVPCRPGRWCLTKAHAAQQSHKDWRIQA